MSHGEKAVTCPGNPSEAVLVAEDEPLVRDIAMRTLQRAGYTTWGAADGEEAVRLFEAHQDRIRLVLLDVMMPRMTGREAYEEIKKRNPHVAVIFCTGYDPAGHDAEFIAQEDLVLLEKPFDPQVLWRTVREVLDRQAADAEPAATVTAPAPGDGAAERGQEPVLG